MEGVKIPSFVGKITFRMHGAQTMTNLAQMLFRFGEYSGIGIKTALGMGAVKMLSEEEMRGRRHSAE
jgi:CRISPR-associated endoribonuclease Cas6